MVDVSAAAITLAAGALGAALLSRWGVGRGFDAAPGPGAAPGDPPVPALGGLGVAFAASLGWVLSGPLSALAATLLAAAWFFLALGLVDDYADLPARARLVIEVLAACLVAALWGRASGAHWLAAAALVPWIIAIVNGLNFLDGSDGLAGCVVVGALVAAAPFRDLGPLPEIVALALLPFLFFNLRPPSRLYLRDAGPRFLGTALALISADAARRGEGALAIGLVLLPLAELISTVVRRAASGSPMLRPDRVHLADRLLARSWPVRGIALGGGILAFVVVLLLEGLA